MNGAFNCCGYRILSAHSGAFIIGTTAEFRYKCYVVSMSQQGGVNVHCPTVYLDGANVHEAESVELALDWINMQEAGRKMAEGAKR